MTFDDVAGNSRRAYCYLLTGAVLRYDPQDGTVRELAHPDRPAAWVQAPLFRGVIPRDGWRHLPGCSCRDCGAAPDDRQVPVGDGHH